MVEALIQVGDPWGLNGHGSARLAVHASRFASDIICVANGRSVNAKDVISAMSVRAKPGTQLHIRATGPDGAAPAMLRTPILLTDRCKGAWPTPADCPCTGIFRSRT
ncbi:HPr family phosphocarrier protein [Paraburkholderia sartisoli]|uniref:HPr family phosphocarrier protein n=1 Tax=Paraburkholderia sartisoli TaxID=83784 RepID=UPI000B8A37C9|nr:HPr family phosphocarrier protein [Paraburkholderia sartisoli]